MTPVTLPAILPMILIVDDDPDALGLLHKVVAANGLVPQVAASGEEALAIIDAAMPDLILLDAVMPGMDGFETCRRIKAIEGAAHVPVIFMTGLSETEHVIKGLAAGGVDYVTKPLAIEELLARMRVHIGNAYKTRSALTALDSLGGRLLATDDDGAIRWATAETQRLLDDLDHEAMGALRGALVRRLAMGEAGSKGEEDEVLPAGAYKFSFSYLGAASAGEHLFSIARSFEGMEAQMLQQELGLTPREADVLLWTARGKSNKDMSEILNISARTVNKHLDHIFIKLGVENRASAAAVATRVLANQR
jgi:DNA-binding response OmpR family regulator/DNA-binding CsgD family transcriptional regulator